MEKEREREPMTLFEPLDPAIPEGSATTGLFS